MLVGPPGTGKSQTISNVICHYLATGKRVLITSKSEGATLVLRNKLPDGVRELAISLGTTPDSESTNRLEAAINYIMVNTHAPRTQRTHARTHARVRSFSPPLRPSTSTTIILW